MVAKFSKKIVQTMVKSNAINQAEFNVYAYGMQILILAIVDWSITFFIMCIMGEYILSFLYLTVFMLLRKNCGGYHAKTHLRCLCLSSAVYILSVVGAKMMENKDWLFLLLLGELYHFFIIIFFSPIEHENKPTSEEKLKKHKKTGRILNTMITCMAFVLFYYGFISYAWIILFAQLSVSISIVFEMKKRKERYK